MKETMKKRYETPTVVVVGLIAEQALLTGSRVKDSAAFTNANQQNKVSIW